MPYIIDFIISIFASLFCTALFLRAWIFWRRIPSFNPYCRFIYQITDFVIIPVRKIISSSNHIDFPSLSVAYIIGVLQIFLSHQFLALDLLPDDQSLLVWLPIEGLYIFLYRLLSCIFWLSMMYAILSWVSPLSPFQSFLRALLEPLLDVIRRHLPHALRNAPFDFSLMALMILIIIAQAVIEYLRVLG